MDLSWLRGASGRISSVNWAKYIREDRQVDPYLVWADMTRFDGFGGWPSTDPAVSKASGDRWPFVVEFATRTTPAPDPGCRNMDREVPVACGLLDVPGTYVRNNPIDGNYYAFAFVTARIVPAALPQVLCDDRIVRIQLALPRIPASDPTIPQVAAQAADANYRVVVGVIDDGISLASPVLNYGGMTRLRYLWDQDPLRQPAGPAAESGSRGGWTLPPGFGYGAELGQSEVARAFSQVSYDRPLAAHEALDYGRLRHDVYAHSASLLSGSTRLPAELMVGATHGHGVVHLAAGHPAPLAEQLSPCSGKEGPPDWDIIFVQLPTRTVLDSSGGSLAGHVLDGIHYIIDRAATLPYKDRSEPGSNYTENRVVINVSYGSIAGGHDGTSMLELALAELVEANYRWIVVSAGNAHRSRTHARLELQPGQSKAIVWRVAPDNPMQSFLEVWIPDVDVGAAGAPQAGLGATVFDTLLISVEGPGLPPTPGFRIGEVISLASTAEANPVAAAIFCRKVAQSNRGTMMLLALAPTGYAKPDGRRRSEVAPHGDWVVWISMDPASAPADVPRVHVHAWTERNELFHGVPRPQQSTVHSDDPIPDPTEFSPEALRILARSATQNREDDLQHPFRPEPSLGSLANGPYAKESFYEMTNDIPPKGPGPGVFDPRLPPTRELGVSRGAVVTVGSHRLLDGEMSIQSSSGPARPLPGADERRAWFAEPALLDQLRKPWRYRLGPDVDAPGDLSPAVPGIRVGGTRLSNFTRISGTSAAAASVTRAIATYWDRARSLDPKDKEALADQLFTSKPERMPPQEARATPTPRKDDVFRRGRRRLR